MSNETAPQFTSFRDRKNLSCSTKLCHHWGIGVMYHCTSEAASNAAPKSIYKGKGNAVPYLMAQAWGRPIRKAINKGLKGI
eukprot:scaffold94161_cov19-Prasinocladus_malaysianus.AAC.1